jgi:amino acid transporter
VNGPPRAILNPDEANDGSPNFAGKSATKPGRGAAGETRANTWPARVQAHLTAVVIAAAAFALSAALLVAAILVLLAGAVLVLLAATALALLGLTTILVLALLALALLVLLVLLALVRLPRLAGLALLTLFALLILLPLLVLLILLGLRTTLVCVLVLLIAVLVRHVYLLNHADWMPTSSAGNRDARRRGGLVQQMVLAAYFRN